MTGDMLLRKILEEPGSDSARLVYADWLEEQGEGERAEFIRLQVDHVALPSCEFSVDYQGHCGLYPTGICDSCERKVMLRRKWHEILHRQHPYGFMKPEPENHYRWAGEPFVGWSGGYSFERGFVKEVNLPSADFIQHAKAIFKAQPVTEIRLTDASAHTLMGRHRFYPVVSKELVDKLAGILEDPREPQDGFATEAEALAHLSSLCVRYGRHLANLPPLVEQTPSSRV